MKNIRVAQVGSFDVENYGDLLFTDVFEHEIREQIPNIEIVLFSPKNVVKPFTRKTQVYSVFDLEEMHLSNRFDAIVIGGGDVIRIDNFVTPGYSNSYDAATLFWQFPILVANRYKIPVLFNNPGVPRKFPIEQRTIVSKFLQTVDYCSVRDKESMNILISCGGENVTYSPDTVMLIDNLYNRDALIKNYSRLVMDNIVPQLNNYIVIQHYIHYIDDQEYVSSLKKFVKYIISDTDYNILMVPIGYVHNDIEFMKKITVESDRVVLFDGKLSPYDMLSVFVNSKGYIGTSLHGIITNSAYKIPIIALNVPRLIKVSGYLELIGKEDIEVNNIDDLKEVFANNFLSEYNDKYYSAKEQVKKHFKKMSTIILSPCKKNYVKALEQKIINSFYEEFENTVSLRSSIEDLIVYIDYGKGYSEENKITKAWDYSDKYYKTKFAISEAKKIRIDPIEGRYIKIKDARILVNKKEIDFNYVNAIKVKDDYYFYSIDPQIEVLLHNGNNEIEVYLKMEIVDYNEFTVINNNLVESINNLTKSIDEISCNNNRIKQENKVLQEEKARLEEKIINKIIKKFRANGKSR